MSRVKGIAYRDLKKSLEELLDQVLDEKNSLLRSEIQSLSGGGFNAEAKVVVATSTQAYLKKMSTVYTAGTKVADLISERIISLPEWDERIAPQLNKLKSYFPGVRFGIAILRVPTALQQVHSAPSVPKELGTNDLRFLKSMKIRWN